MAKSNRRNRKKQINANNKQQINNSTLPDEIKFSKQQLEYLQKMDFQQLAKLNLLNLKMNPYMLRERLIGKFTREDILKALATPELDSSQSTLRRISRELYNTSSHYKRLINYIAGIIKWNYYIEPVGLNLDKVNPKTFKTAYNKTVNYVENMNIKHEMSKIMPMLVRDDMFAGYIIEDSKSFMIFPLDVDYVKVSSLEDGIYNIAFNMTYFNAFPYRIDQYPPEFKIRYQNFLDGKDAMWQEISMENTIVLKMDWANWFSLPFFVGIFTDLLDIFDFKSLRKAKEKIDNYKILFQKIPVDEKSGNKNDFLITLDYVTQFHENIEEGLPDQVGLISSPMEVTEIKFDRDKVDKNKVNETTKDFFVSAGVSDLLFSSDSSSSTGLAYSVKVDEALMFGVVRQFERWLNRYLKNIGGSYQFRTKFLDTTIFNEKDVTDKYVNLGQYGFPVIPQIAASIGMEPSSMSSMLFLQNDILGLTPDRMKPLASAHTQSGKDNNGAGREALPEDKVSDAGRQTRDNGSNENRDNTNI